MDLAALTVFVEAVDHGSLAAAARRIGISAMAASRSLAALEAELGVRLVHRTTRALSVTAEGEAFLPHARAMVDARDSALAALRPGADALSGRLRITASAAFGRSVLAPMLVPFMHAHPGLHVDLLLTDEAVDIVRQGIDVAIRIAPLRDNHLVARALAANPRRLCAAPAYLATHPAPRRLADLAGHCCLAGTNPAQWRFVRQGRLRQQTVSGRLTASSIEALRAAAIGGLGIANLSDWYIADDLAQGRLVTVPLDDAEPEPLTIWAVHPTARLVPPRVKAFVSALEAVLKAH